MPSQGYNVDSGNGSHIQMVVEAVPVLLVVMFKLIMVVMVGGKASVISGPGSGNKRWRWRWRSLRSGTSADLEDLVAVVLDLIMIQIVVVMEPITLVEVVVDHPK